MKLSCTLAVITLAVTSLAYAQDGLNMNLAMANTTKEVRFLEQNKKREGVKVTKTGLQYEVLKEGQGKSPDETDVVTVHYEGKLINGTVFDSSYRRNKPATFVLNQVIRGWTEGVQLMKPGAIYVFYIPAKLAYGAEGSPPTIGPNECLIFKVELIAINPPKQ